MLKEFLLKLREKVSFKNIKKVDFKKGAKFLPLVLILVMIGLVLPSNFAHADLIMEHVVYPVIYVILSVLFEVAYVITWIGASLLNAVLNPTIMNTIFANKAIYNGWTLIRDVCNLLFLLIMLLVAFGTILQSEKYNIKNSLSKLIIAIFLINFSYPIAGVIVDFGNILMYGILAWRCPSESATCFQDFYKGLMAVVRDFRSDYSWERFVFSNTTNLQAAIGLAVATIYTYMYGFILLAMAGFLLVRTVALALLLILAPFAYFGEVMPGMQNLANKWWDNLWSYMLFGPIFALMFFISGELARNILTMKAPPLVNTDLGALGPIVSAITVDILPLLFLLAIIPITKSLGLAGTETIMKNTVGFGESVGKFAGSAVSDTWGRMVARGAGMKAKEGDGFLRRAYIKARNVGSYASPTAWKDAYNAKKAKDKHDYDAAKGRIQDKMGWKSKYIESEQDRVTDEETHKAFGEMGIKNKDEMVYALKTAVKEGNGPMVAEIMRTLAVNGDTDAALDAFKGEKDRKGADLGITGHTAEDYNRFMNKVVKPLLGEKGEARTAKLSNEIGKSEEKNNNFIYGGHDSYDKANNTYSMRNMVEGSDEAMAKAKEEQQKFMLMRWNSKDEFSRIGTVGKNNFEGKKEIFKDSSGKDVTYETSEEGAMFLGELQGSEALKQIKRFKPRVAEFIEKNYKHAFEELRKPGAKIEGTIFEKMNEKQIQTAQKVYDRIVAIREGKYRDYNDEDDQGNEEGGKGGGKTGGKSGHAGGSTYNANINI